MLGVQMNLGEVLSAARSAAHLSIDDLASMTSIRAGLISQMEKNDFSQCGGDIYARGHLRNIAPKVGLDPQSLLDIFNEEHSTESRSINEMLAESNVTRVPQEKKNLSWKVPAAFSIAIVIILAVVQIVISNVNSDGPATPTPTESSSSEASTPASPAPTVSPSQMSSPPAQGVSMTITAVRGNSRIDIVIDGVHVAKGSIFQGESKSFESSSSISVYFSNPAGLDVTVNGELLAPLGGQNEEVRRTFR